MRRSGGAGSVSTLACASKGNTGRHKETKGNARRRKTDIDRQLKRNSERRSDKGDKRKALPKNGDTEA